MILAGSLAAFLLLLGITPPYPEIWKRRGRVVGISQDRQTMSMVLADSSRFCILGNGLPWGSFVAVRSRYILSIILYAIC